MITPPEVFQNNYSQNYGRNLSLQLIPQNVISSNSLRIGNYYGYSGEGIINKLSSQWKTFHIVRYDGIERGFLRLYCLFSLFYIIDIYGKRIIHWTNGIDSDMVRNLNNKMYYQLNPDITRDMILADETILDDRKNELIRALNASSESITCSICMTNPLNRVITQCGHTLCSECAINPAFQACHICRIQINPVIHIIPLYIG
jgi:dissimilatory sulfite reductase (desulfoviridin) alpha/beta subunit